MYPGIFLTLDLIAGTTTLTIESQVEAGVGSEIIIEYEGQIDGHSNVSTFEYGRVTLTISRRFGRKNDRIGVKKFVEIRSRQKSCRI